METISMWKDLSVALMIVHYFSTIRIRNGRRQEPMSILSVTLCSSCWHTLITTSTVHATGVCPGRKSVQKITLHVLPPFGVQCYISQQNPHLHSFKFDKHDFSLAPKK